MVCGHTSGHKGVKFGLLILAIDYEYNIKYHYFAHRQRKNAGT